MKQNTGDCIRFFDDFVADFSTFDGRIIARRYHAPYTAIDAQGRHQVLSSHNEITGYFQSYLDKYAALGCVSCGYADLEIAVIDKKLLLATVTWALYSESREIVSSWRESYNLSYQDDKLLVHASVDHQD